MEQKEMGSRIAQLRSEIGETQQQLADSLGIKRETVKFWESGDRQIKGNDIIKLARHFGVTADFILGLSGVKSLEPKLQEIGECTGLNDASLRVLSEIKDKPDNRDALNYILGATVDRGNFREIMHDIASAHYFAFLLQERISKLKTDADNQSLGELKETFWDMYTYYDEAIAIFTKRVDEYCQFSKTRKLYSQANDEAINRWITKEPDF